MMEEKKPESALQDLLGGSAPAQTNQAKEGAFDELFDNLGG